MEDYINPITLKKIGIENIVTSKTLPNLKTMKMIKTPNVLKRARAHFGCNDLQGVPVEYNGGDGTAGAHWSKKYMNTDFMIGDSYGENIISEITVGLFEDSGWYTMDYNMANQMVWGRNKGCDFFDTNKKCIVKQGNTYVSNFNNEFCAKLNYPVCSIGNVFRASCAGKRYPAPLHPFESFFNDPRVGGTDNLTDKCPIPYEESGDQKFYGGSCRVGRTNNLNKLEKVGVNSICFMSTLTPSAYRVETSTTPNTTSSNKLRFKQLEYVDSPELTANDPRARCYEQSCQGHDLYVKLNNSPKTHRCPSNKQISIDGYDGVIYCPDNGVICNPKFNCKFGCISKWN